MRYLIALVILIAAAACGLLAYHELTLGPPVVLSPPRDLRLTAAGGVPLLPDGWTNSGALTVSTAAAAGANAHLDVEVRPVGDHFSGSPTPSTDPPGRPSAIVHLRDGDYHWQVRLHNAHGVSPWVISRSPVKVDTRPPTLPQISSPTDPDPATLYHSSTARFDWHAADTGSGITGYSYRLDADPHGAARPELRTAQPTITLTGLQTGHWYFHVRALDRAGNWGPSATLPIRLDVTPPGLAHVRFSLFQFDPQYDTLRVSFAVTRPATSLHVGVYRQSDNALVRMYKLDNLAKGQETTVSWDGKDAHGTAVDAGAYSIFIRATDQYGHSSLTGWHDFIVTYKRIVVSLSQQRLTAYDGSHVFLTTLVTTGNRALPTPKGTYHVMGKFHPYTFISPWPKSSQYYYAPSKVQWALLFREGGYFLHDAPWRGVFGPGSNAEVGTPGQNYTGTHGCVNVPSTDMSELYAWAEVGTIVQVVA